MRKSNWGFGGALAVVATMAVLAFMTAALLPGAGQWAWAEPPADQEYTGSKRCASCHFEQFMQWKKTGHSKAFANLTAKYQSDAKCLECHTTGYGKPSGFKTAASSPGLEAVGCEVCHGPGSKHEEAAKPFAQKKDLSPEEEQLVKGTVWRVLPQNICLDCHTVQKHGESQTPPEMRKK